MAMNYAVKYAPLVDERFKLGALTGEAVNRNYDWAGVRTLRVYALDTAPMVDYEREGRSRYGSPQELDGGVQELTIKRDRAFTFTIDRGLHGETMMAADAGQALRRQLDEQVIPEIDKYRLRVMACGAGAWGSGSISKTKAYETLLAADMAMAEGNVPPFGRTAFVSPQFYKLIKLDNAFVRQGDGAQQMLISGAVGMVDNLRIVRVPAGYLPMGTDFIVVHPEAVTAAEKLADYKIHDNPPGINGWLVEGRVCYDAFAMENKGAGIYLHQSALGDIPLVLKTAGTGLVAVGAVGATGTNLVYQVGGTLPALGDDLSSWTALPGDGVVSASPGDAIVVAAVVDGKAVLAGDVVV